MLHLSGLEKRYGKNLALRDLSIDIEEGDVICLVGPNGSGKSTLLKIILGLINSDSGKISMDRDGLRFGYMSEVAKIPGNMTALRLLNSLKGILSGGEDISAKIIDLFDMKEYLAKPVKSYSKGMLKKLAFLLATLNSPDVLVLDEPFEGLDTIDRDKLNKFITQYAQGGKTVILSTHILYELDRVVTKAIFLKKGDLVVTFMPPSQNRAEREITFGPLFRDYLDTELNLNMTLTIADIYRRVYQ
jgi:ABC-type multidrug transport system ATPase subunit